MSLSSTHLAINDKIWVSFMTRKFSNIWTYHIVSVKSFTDRHRDWFHILTIVNSGIIDMECNIGTLTSFLCIYPQKRETTIICGRSSFRFLKELHIVLYNGCTKITHSPTAYEFLFSISSWALDIFRVFFSFCNSHS
jgi:hypothetical protein